MIIKKKFVMLAALSTLMLSTSALATYRVDVQCLDRVMLTDVHAGYIKSASGGPDAGNAVVISWEKNYEQGSTSFHVFKNLNDYPAEACSRWPCWRWIAACRSVPGAMTPNAPVGFIS